MNGIIFTFLISPYQNTGWRRIGGKIMNRQFIGEFLGSYNCNLTCFGPVTFSSSETNTQMGKAIKEYYSLLDTPKPTSLMTVNALVFFIGKQYLEQLQKLPIGGELNCKYGVCEEVLVHRWSDHLYNGEIKQLELN